MFDQGWTLEALYSALESGYDLIVCEKDAVPVGYLLSLSVLDEIQIMQIAVAEACRRQGLAAAMTAFLLEHAGQMACVTLEVRVSNHAARALYAGRGFETVGLRRKYYPPDASGFSEDALLMSWNIQ